MDIFAPRGNAADCFCLVLTVSREDTLEIPSARYQQVVASRMSSRSQRDPRAIILVISPYRTTGRSSQKRFSWKIRPYSSIDLLEQSVSLSLKLIIIVRRQMNWSEISEAANWSGISEDKRRELALLDEYDQQWTQEDIQQHLQALEEFDEDEDGEDFFGLQNLDHEGSFNIHANVGEQEDQQEEDLEQEREEVEDKQLDQKARLQQIEDMPPLRYALSIFITLSAYLRA